MTGPLPKAEARDPGVDGFEVVPLKYADVSEVVGLDHSFALTYLIYVLIVVSLGGMGSIGGTFAAAVLLGVSDIAGKYYVPQVSAFLIYVLMVGLLMWRPIGLFGKR